MASLSSLVTLSDADRDYAIALAGGSSGFSTQIHRDDEMYRFCAAHQNPEIASRPAQAYFRSGREMLDQLAGLLTELARPLSGVNSFLDFACGYGRFTRFLTRSIAPSKITVADVTRAAVDFQVDAFGVKGFYSDVRPADVVMPRRYEMIFVASLFSHLPYRTWRVWLGKLYEALEPGGLLIFTTHGPTCMSQLDQRAQLPFSYIPHSESEWLKSSDYGTTYVTSDYVRRVVFEETGETELVHRPQAIWSYQDAYAVTKTDGPVRSGGATDRLRSCVRMAQSSSAARAEARPVFVLGSGRSGATVIANGLVDCAAYHGWPRGHSLPLLGRFLSDLDECWSQLRDSTQDPRTTSSILDRQWFQDRLASLFLDPIEELIGLSRWVDQGTGSAMLRACPMLAETLPQSRFIFTRRRGIETVISWRDKNPTVPFEDACQRWTDAMREWRLIRDELGPRAVEIEQSDIALQPERTVRKMGDLLQLSELQTQALIRYLSTQRPNLTTVPADHFHTDLEETLWSEEERRLFRAICGRAMEENGYSFRGWSATAAEPRELALFYPASGTRTVVANCPSEAQVAARPDGFLLHPNNPDQTDISVTYERVRLDGQNSFSSRVFVDHRESEPVRFTVSLHPTQGGEKLEESIDVCPTSPKDWQARFHAVQGVYDLTLSTAMAPGSKTNSFAWAVWCEPRFLLV